MHATQKQFEQLYHAEPLAQPHIPIHVKPFSISDTVPTEADIVHALLHLR